MNRAKIGTSRADKKLSNFGMQLLEKQRLRAYYGVMEKEESSFSGKLIRIPERDEVPIEIDDQLIVEYYSRLL